MGSINNKKKNSLKKENKTKNSNNNKIKDLNEDFNNKDIKLLSNLVNDSFGGLYIGNIFIAFKSINNILLLIYGNTKKSIISYDINYFKKINEIKNAHEAFVSNLNHYLDIINKRDLILSIPYGHNVVKVWNINNCECLIHITNINRYGYLDSACFLNDNNKIYIISSNANNVDNEERDQIKIFNLKGIKKKEIDNSNEDIYFIDTYYDNKLSKIFIIVCCSKYSKSYDYNNNLIYRKYSNKFDFSKEPCYIIINKKNEIVRLFESNFDGNIRIWNFHSGKLLKKINVSGTLLRGISLLDEEYIFVGCEDKEIKIVNYNNGKIIRILSGHINRVVSIKIIKHPKYGNCLLSQGSGLDPIKLWDIKT